MRSTTRARLVLCRRMTAAFVWPQFGFSAEKNAAKLNASNLALWERIEELRAEASGLK